MKNLVFASLCIFLFSCGPKKVQEVPMVTQENVVPETQVVQALTPVISTTNSSAPEPESELLEENGDFEEYATYYVTIADTGQLYYPLREKMVTLYQALPLPIDTMDRYYDSKKDLIALPEDYEDDLFAGDYFPRRGPDVHLSLEYLDLYQRKAGKKTIALVSGIYEKKTSADSALQKLKHTANKAFVVKTKMYIGCIH